MRHVLEAPVVIACGSELLTFVKGHKMAPPGSEYFGANSEDWEEIKQFIPDAHMSTAIGITHLILTATALGLGTCWVQRIRYGQLAKILGWPRHIVPLALIPVGYPDEDPAPRPRQSMENMVLREGHIPQ
jgi:nitroreductase